MIASESATPLLSVSNLRKSFQGVNALNGCTFRVEENAILGLIGPNGAGKSVTINTISGLIKPDAGDVWYRGESIIHLPPHEIANHGIGRTYQEVRIFSNLSVLDNVLFAQQEKEVLGNFRSLFLGRHHTEHERVRAILQEVGLEGMQDELAGNLSYGQRKLLEFANVMSREPTLVLLDEPMAGVNPAKIDHILNIIRSWHERGTSFLIIEHNMKVIMAICQRVAVLVQGEVIIEGSPEEIQRDESVIEAYFGDS